MSDDATEEMIAAATEQVSIKVAIDSGAVDNILNPVVLPCDAQPVPNTSGRHFVGAKGERIDKCGSCDTRLEGRHGSVGCKWQLADVTRSLHSVSKITGAADGPAKQDVLFTNTRCVVVAPGVVEKILKDTKPITEYQRQGGLYVADMTMSSFGRQGLAP